MEVTRSGGPGGGDQVRWVRRRSPGRVGQVKVTKSGESGGAGGDQEDLQ